MNRLEELKNVWRQPINYDDPKFASFIPYKEVNKIHGLIEFCEEFVTKDTVMIELGTGRGVSTEVFAHFAKLVYTIDMRRWDDTTDKNISVYENIIPIVDNTYNTYSGFEDNSIDLIYLDSDHEFNHVKKELSLYRPKLKITGICSGHDYQEQANDVIKAVNEVFGKPDKVYKDSTWVVDLKNRR